MVSSGSRSASDTSPTSRPVESTTGNALIRCRTMSAAASLQWVSGVTVIAGDVIASFALIARAYGRSAAPTAAGGPPTGRPPGTRPRVPDAGTMNLRRLHMSETIPMSAADLVVHGTFDLRCAMDRRATRARHAEPPVSRLERLEVQIEARPLRERSAVMGSPTSSTARRLTSRPAT